MKRILLALILAISCISLHAQKTVYQDTAWKNIYRGTPQKINSLVHTKLDVKFDFEKSYLMGKEWLTLEPYFYATDSVILDAKGMQINEVAIINGSSKKDLKYQYDGLQLTIKLDRMYKGGEKYTLYFDYISKPNEFKTQGSAAITDAKGLYFIKPEGGKVYQFWTQGETEANSVWFITIDKPNQKTTQEISMTVPTTWTTLSNGLLISKKENKDSTRTDNWKMDLPHAPYLVFMGAGEFSVIKDQYKGKEVSYYVEKEYAPYARGIFGHTPEMIKFFEEKLNVPYVWPKYSQMVGRDYVSGAMENTTSTLHGEFAYQNNRELADGNSWESTIAHELFHHWFGDLVTAESWSNLTLNESFANYSEYLWNEYKYGKDYADAEGFKDMQGYLFSGSDKKDLVRYYYADKEDMFDAVSYNKGGRILHMLRNYVGDDAFFKSLNLYLTEYKFKTAEASQLRTAFEAVTGQDLHWFWNQWYYGSGNPKLNINYLYNDSLKIASVIVNQTQKSEKIFKLPIAIDVYESGQKTRYNVFTSSLSDTFNFSYNVRPTLINFDAEKILLAEKTDNKTEQNFVEQWKNANNWLDRKEAIDYFAKNTMPEIAKGLTDKFAGLRLYTIQKISKTPYKDDAAVISTIEDIAEKDRDKKTKAEAIKFLVKTGSSKYLDMFIKNVNDSSYSVAGEALQGIYSLDAKKAYEIAKTQAKDARKTLQGVVTTILIEQGTESDFEIILNNFESSPLSDAKIGGLKAFATYVSGINDLTKVKKGIDAIVSSYNSIPAGYKSYFDKTFQSALTIIGKAKGKKIEDYIHEKMK